MPVRGALRTGIVVTVPSPRVQRIRSALIFNILNASLSESGFALPQGANPTGAENRASKNKPRSSANRIMGDILSIIEQRTINDRSEHHRGADAVRGRRQGAPARTLREDHAPHHHAGRARMALRCHPGHHRHRHRQGQAGRQYLLRRIQRRGRPGRHGPDPPGDLHLQRRPRLQLHIPAIGIHRAQTHRRDRHRPRARRPLHARRQPRNPAAGQ